MKTWRFAPLSVIWEWGYKRQQILNYILPTTNALKIFSIWIFAPFTTSLTNSADVLKFKYWSLSFTFLKEFYLFVGKNSANFPSFIIISHKLWMSNVHSLNIFLALNWLNKIALGSLINWMILMLVFEIHGNRLLAWSLIVLIIILFDW